MDNLEISALMLMVFVGMCFVAAEDISTELAEEEHYCTMVKDKYWPEFEINHDSICEKYLVQYEE